MASYSMDQFVADVKAIEAQSSDPASILKGIAPLAKKIAGNKDWVNEKHYQIDASQGMGIQLVHKEPEGLFIVTVCWQPGIAVIPHDHQTWACIVGIDGEEHNVSWNRKDDGSKEGYAKLEQAEELIVRNGDVCTLLPGEIHSVRNDGSTPSVSLHIYGKNLGHVDRNEFDPEKNTIQLCPRRKRSN